LEDRPARHIHWQDVQETEEIYGIKTRNI